MSTRPLAVVTMVYDDAEFLPIWLKYWCKHLPREHLYVLVHGPQEALIRTATAEGVNVQVVPRPEPHETMEEERWELLSDLVATMLESYDTVVYTDVDEILVSEPFGLASIAERLIGAKAPVAFATGLEIIHRPDQGETALNWDQPVLSQRRFYRPTSFHSKPCIVKSRIRWARGGHFCDQPNITFASRVYCIHLRFVDQSAFLERAERRRQTTKSSDRLRAFKHRRWRHDADGARQLMVEQLEWPRNRLPRIAVSSIREKMLQSLATSPNDHGQFRYKLVAENHVTPLPRRYRNLF